MNFYRYKLITSSGRVVSGVIKLPYENIMSAISHLERDGSMTIFVKRAGPLTKAVFKGLGSRLRGRLTRSEQAEMLSNLALMLRSGLPLLTALQEAAEGALKLEVKTDICDMIMSIQGGRSFSETAARYPHLIPESVIHLVRMGEETGRLDTMLKEASEHLKRIHQIMGDTKQALLYPAFVMVAIGGGLVFWLHYVVPKIITLFKEMDVVLPPMTVALIHVSSFMRQHAVLVLAVAAAAVCAVFAARRSSLRVRFWIDSLLLKTPILHSLISASSLAFITEYFSMLLKAGIEILQSLQIVIDSVGSEVYRKKMVSVREAIIHGACISDAFKNAGIFPSFVVRMISVGEMSGTLNEQLETISAEYRAKLSLLVSALGKMLEPLVLVIAGAFFAVIILALLLPIYDLVGHISN